MKTSAPRLTRITISLALAIPMCFVELSKIDKRGLGVVGYICVLSIYWVIQAFTGFEKPLHGAAIVFVLAILYWLALPGWAH